MAYNSNRWVECTKIYVVKDAAYYGGVFFNSYTGAGAKPDVWTTVDLSDTLPKTAKAINLSGILIITHGDTPETADLTLNFRTDNNSIVADAHAQVVEAHLGGGQRCTMSTWIELDSNQCFQYKWDGPNAQYTWPIYSSYGANLRVVAFGE